jgi:hypothetical protein
MSSYSDKVLRIVEAVVDVQQELLLKDEEVVSILQDVASKYTVYKKIILLSIPL